MRGSLSPHDHQPDEVEVPCFELCGHRAEVLGIVGGRVDDHLFTGVDVEVRDLLHLAPAVPATVVVVVAARAASGRAHEGQTGQEQYSDHENDPFHRSLLSLHSQTLWSV